MSTPDAVFSSDLRRHLRIAFEILISSRDKTVGSVFGDVCSELKDVETMLKEKFGPQWNFTSGIDPGPTPDPRLKHICKCCGQPIRTKDD